MCVHASICMCSLYKSNKSVMFMTYVVFCCVSGGARGDTWSEGHREGGSVETGHLRWSVHVAISIVYISKY